MTNIQSIRAIYVADPLYLSELKQEITDILLHTENLIFSSKLDTCVTFARDIWLDPVIVPIVSISDAVKALKKAGRFWYHYPLEHQGRGKLIAAELRKLPVMQHTFPLTTSIPAIGYFTLLDKNTLIYSTTRWKEPPLGDYQFIEDKVNPPNRAYLKLWEALTLCGEYPKPGDRALDLGASPGGWTYVMHALGAHVTAVDKASLTPELMREPRITFLQQSAFALSPDTIATPFDWVLCDIACYPERTLQLIQTWMASGKAKRFIFTLKLQGETDFEVIRAGKAIPGARVLHLLQNKHEVTFFYTSKTTSSSSWPSSHILETTL